jgi:hypothetical protein
MFRHPIVPTGVTRTALISITQTTASVSANAIQPIGDKIQEITRTRIANHKLRLNQEVVLAVLGVKIFKDVFQAVDLP